MRCYSPKFLSLPLVFRRGVGECHSSRVDDLPVDPPIVSSSSVLRRMPNAPYASYQNRFCSAALSSFAR